MSNKLVFFVFFWLSSIFVFGQENNISIGNWRVHLPYQNMNTLAVSDQFVYTARGNSIFYFDREEKSVNIESKYTGLKDVLVSKVSYNESQDAFLIGYESGNIDIIKNNKIVNANEIVRKNTVGSKKINHFYSNGNIVYVSGNFGIAVYDLNKYEVKESYTTLTANGSGNNVYASTLTTDKDSIFIATSNGVMAARVSSTVNLMDFNNWVSFGIAEGIESEDVISVCANNGFVYAAVNNKGIYYYNGTTWNLMTVPMVSGGNIRSLTQSNNSILACIDSALYQISSPLAWTEILQIDKITPTEAYFDKENTLWVSTFNGGLLHYSAALSIEEYRYPNGPLTTGSFRFGYYDNNLISLVGGYNNIGQKSYSSDWFSVFENNTDWKIGRYEYGNIPVGFGDIISATYNERNSTLYLSAFGDGLVALKPNDKSVVVYTDANSPLERSTSFHYVGETALDDDGKLWVPMKGINIGLPNLYSLSSEGEWEKYTVESNIRGNIIGVTIDANNTKWLKTSAPSGQTGIILFNEESNTVRTLTTAAGQGALPDIKINCITKDNKGVILIGTDKGLAVCYDAASMLKSGVDLTTPIFDGFPILFDRNVLSIEVDGGNRKWIGTNDGLWLFDPDLTKVLMYFDEENSPLFSDLIMAIKVHPKSGEVFFATPLGLCSYRGTSTEADEDFSDVKVFPNPVEPGFNGLVGISGLASNVSVKITDVAGNLVYETVAEGGTAVWNVKDYNGNRAASGIYLIYCSDEEGTAKFVSKIAVVE